MFLPIRVNFYLIDRVELHRLQNKLYYYEHKNYITLLYDYLIQPIIWSSSRSSNT